MVALINHSCDPNAVVVFPRAGSNSYDEPLMHVIALKHIAPNEEILTAYIDTTLPTAKRQALLKDTYHFTCQCGLCKPTHGATSDLREAMWCPKKCGGVCPVPTEGDRVSLSWSNVSNGRIIENSLTQCTRCKAPVKDTDAVLDALRVGQEALDKAEALQFSGMFPTITLAEVLTLLCRSRKGNSAHNEAGPHPDLRRTCTSVAPAPSTNTAQYVITHHPSTFGAAGC